MTDLDPSVQSALEKLLDERLEAKTQEAMQSTDSLFKAIVSGMFDDDLDAIGDAVSARKKTLSKASFYEFKPGDRVRLRDLRPKYLAGCEGTVVEKKQTRIYVKLDRPPAPKWEGSIGATPNMLERI